MPLKQTLTPGEWETSANQGDYVLNRSTGNYDLKRGGNSKQVLTPDEYAAVADQGNYTRNPTTGQYERNQNAPRDPRDPNAPRTGKGGRRSQTPNPNDHAMDPTTGEYLRDARGGYVTLDPESDLDPTHQNGLLACAQRLQVLTSKLGSGMPAGDVERVREGFVREVAHIRSMVTGADDPYAPVPEKVVPLPRT